tara:strand:+ start:42 stop:566 length:525 start_codon:yes stop_codon:yes gene_type:complete
MGQFEEDTAAANKLFVEAVKLVKMAENAEALHEWRKGLFNLRTPRSKKADALLLALRKLNEIIDDYPSTDLAVKLISEDTGSISLEGVGEVAEKAREEAERAAEEARSFKKTLKAAEQGDAVAQFSLGVMYYKGHGVPENDAEAVKWYRKAAEQGNEGAKKMLKALKYSVYKAK